MADRPGPAARRRGRLNGISAPREAPFPDRSEAMIHLAVNDLMARRLTGESATW